MKAHERTELRDVRAALLQAAGMITAFARLQAASVRRNTQQADDGTAIDASTARRRR